MESSAPLQHLHNFDLPNLKWKKDHQMNSTTPHHNRRRSTKSPTRDSVSESPIRAAAPASPGKGKGKIEEEKPKEESEIKRSKILIKIPRTKPEQGEKKSPQDEPTPTPPKIGSSNNGDQLTSDEINDEEVRIWNLRPRNPKRKSNDIAIVDPGKTEKSNTNKPAAGEKKKEKKKQLSLSISLTKEEIEEDMYSFTGLKPSRRPRKRPKNVQKKMDSVFPGLWLVSISPDSYKVSENYMKG